MGDFKLFIRYLFRVYILPILLVITLLFIMLNLGPQKITEKDLYNAYKNDIESYNWIAGIDSIDGVILGSSTLRYGLSCGLLKSQVYKQWVNLSMDARDPIVFYLLLKKNIKLFKPKIVLVGLDPWIYSKLYYRNRATTMYSDFKLTERLNYFLSIDYRLPIILCKNQFAGTNKKPETKNDKIPPDFGSVKLTRNAVNFNEINDDWFRIKEFGWSKIQFEYLHKLKILCQSHRINLVFIVSPKRNDYINVVNSNFKLYHQDWWNQINSDLQNEQIIGTYDALKKFNQDSIFAEAFHLNNNGQIIFSEYVRKFISKPSKINKHYNFIHSSKSN
jgi:hypothetical protein